MSKGMVSIELPPALLLTEGGARATTRPYSPATWHAYCVHLPPTQSIATSTPSATPLSVVETSALFRRLLLSMPGAPRPKLLLVLASLLVLPLVLLESRVRFGFGLFESRALALLELFRPTRSPLGGLRAPLRRVPRSRSVKLSLALLKLPSSQLPYPLSPSPSASLSPACATGGIAASVAAVSRSSSTNWVSLWRSVASVFSSEDSTGAAARYVASPLLGRRDTGEIKGVRGIGSDEAVANDVARAGAGSSTSTNTWSQNSETALLSTASSTTAMQRAPSHRPSCRVARPTRLPAPNTTTTSPVRALAFSCSASHAVTYGTPSTAAEGTDTFSGFSTTADSGTAMNWL
mmetsp:Transcript_5494/g.12113  ORF Transcript_5494/g.12113 Transcript_5494/m.12113 type:complete len:349 (+) Transcript_5494:1756-2802(+)